ncbi:5-formyltetrahydrofolate cyclo-ligase [Morganella morganii subsp. sibonii]|uniref:5-formyltetrahydrofolate cyclo-ligase n=1 Tax=Morganella morganii TaxID=582 RepID=UPI0006C4005A|nr:5-formyltetrahydrofolate cyclo-ligase [Morganella morganii]KOO18855.1 5-formyltetrahydrofolate cyclo-ligase [Morganella morganii]SPX91267.1 5-formyltetrahydrofolate cyclo-ligase family protein [Morganella morganii]HCT8188301.1 5-formyltetrahydrofolate cyclo-ligase [Morganella morganii]
MTHDPLLQSRHHLRQLIRNKRRALTPQQQTAAAQDLVQQITHHPGIDRADNIALFLSFDGEIDTRPLTEWLWSQGKHVYLPVLHPFSRHHLLFLAYRPDTPLIKNKFSISEPALDVTQVLPPQELDIMFIPLVAFDEKGGRLGMGGGFYDRTLADWQKKGFYPLGLAHDCQQVSELPVAEWDVPLPEVITPSRRWLWPEHK